MKKLEWPGGKVVLSFSLSRDHAKVLQRLADEARRAEGRRQASTSAVVRGLIERAAARKGWAIP